MRISVTLYGLLRQKVPPEAKGKVTLDLPEGSTIDQVTSQLGLTGQVVVSVNGQLTHDRSVPLHDGDVLLCFNPSGGGQPAILL
jgi:sulfur carrier protein ThiS